MEIYEVSKRWQDIHVHIRTHHTSSVICPPNVTHVPVKRSRISHCFSQDKRGLNDYQWSTNDTEEKSRKMKLQIIWIIFKALLERTEQHWLDGAEFSCLPLIASDSLKKNHLVKKKLQKLVLFVPGFFIIGHKLT